MRSLTDPNRETQLSCSGRSARWSVWLDGHLVIDGGHDPLPGAEIPFRGLHRPMPEQELDLLKLSTG
jgi:hypothetical protein